MGTRPASGTLIRDGLAGLAAALCGILVVREMTWLGAAFIAGASYLLIRRHRLGTAAIFVVAVFLPVSLGQVGRIPDLLLIEVAAPVLGAAGIVQLVRGANYRSGLFVYSAFLVMVLGILATLHLSGILGEMGALGANPAAPNTRAYFRLYAAAMTLPGMLFLLGRIDWSEDRLSRFLHTLGVVGVAAGATRLITYRLGLDMPLLAGTFRYAVEETTFGMATQRIGGLAEAAILATGVAVALRLSGDRSWRPPTYALVGLVLVVLGGGRASFLGIVLGLFAVSIVANRGGTKIRVIAGLVAAMMVAWWMAVSLLPAQYARLVTLLGGAASIDAGRLNAIRLMTAEFYTRPIAGKGLGGVSVGAVDVFVYEQVAMGGHTAYVSMLANFGAIGFGVLVLLLVGTALAATRVLRRQAAPSCVRALAGAVLFLIGVRAIEYTVAGNGYSDFALYGVLAIQIIAHELVLRHRGA